MASNEGTRERVSLTQSELESRLLAAANSLRGPVDPADFKQFVFPLLFLKRLSDNWDAEQSRAEAEYAPKRVPAAAMSEFHVFDLPEGCRWGDLRKIADNVGYGLQLILDRIQEANPTKLAGIFGETAWANKERLPEHALVTLIEIFNGIPLDPVTVSHDMLGQAYEYLLKYFADESGKKAGEFFTPRAVVRLLTRLLSPQAGDTIYDPACGSAGMLVEAVNEVRESGGHTGTLKLYGQEVNLTTAAIARMNLYMHDIEDFLVLRGDTLREPKFKSPSGDLRRFDLVLANPPFSLKNWGAEAWSNDPYGRSFCGVPPSKNADYAWIQHMLASMNKKGGRVGVVMPHGALFRPGIEAAIRECIVAGDLLDSVIGLPPNLFYSTPIPACLLIFKAQKPVERRNKVFFVNAAKCFRKDRAQNLMEDAHIDRVVEIHAAAVDEETEEASARWVGFDELKANEWNLNIGRYLRGAAVDVIDSATALALLAAAKEELDRAQEAVAASAAELGL